MHVLLDVPECDIVVRVADGHDPDLPLHAVSGISTANEYSVIDGFD